MENDRAEVLLNKYLNGECTPEEKALVESWFLEETKDLEDKLPEPDYDLVKGKVWSSIQEKNAAISKPSIKLWPRFAAAASIVILLSAGLYFYSQHNSRHERGRDLASADINPGKNSATLTLANGQKIVLSNAANGELAKESGVSITKAADGKLVYKITGSDNNKVQYNTLTTANGEQFQVVLPDGSAVWLNAASSLKFPSTFANLSHRDVELSGEAYFEITHDKTHPFTVKTAIQDVTVLGTHFDINSYANEAITKTTLLQGSVRVTPTKATNGSSLPVSTAARELKPGEQALNSGDNIQVQKADTELAIAWKNNKFMFEKDNIENIMRMVERWYNVEVVYQGEIPDDKFGGSVSRFDKVSKVLSILELTGNVHFKIEGRRITVTK